MLNNINFKQFITLQRGFDLPSKDRKDGEFPVVASTSINGYHDKYKVNPPGVVTGRSGSLGEVQYVTKPFWPLNTTLWVRDFKGNLPKYVYYYLKILDLARFNSGAGVPTLNRNDLDNLEISIHPFSMQKKVVAILSTYDDLIENNDHRIKILDDMVQVLYKEWFVKFKFPGHEKVKMVESELGLIPEGWGVSDIYNIIEEINERNKENNDIYVYSVTNNKGFVMSDELFSKRVYSKSLKNYKIVKHNEFAFNPARINIGSIAMFQDDDMGLVSPMYSIFRANTQKVLPYILWNILNEELVLDQIKSLSYGTVRQIFKIKDFSLIQRPIAPIKMQQLFCDNIQPMLDLKKVLEKGTEKLRESRDLLLPKLISGELDVGNLDIDIESEVESN